MITLRPSESRGRTRIDWLDARHSFSFGEYDDPDWRAFRTLRVINQDIVAPGGGFSPHPHRDMEIVTLVLRGRLDHADAIGDGHQQSLLPGEVQRISAGTGMVHSEFNGSRTEPVELLQIWIKPDQRGRTPRYEQRPFNLDGAGTDARAPGKLVTLVAPQGKAVAGDRPEDSRALEVFQDAWVYHAALRSGQSITHALAPGRGAWVQVISGEVSVNGRALKAGDAAAIEDEPTLTLQAATKVESVGSDTPARVLLFDLS